MQKYKSIIFDLDDTLLDTTKWLLEGAILETCSFLSTLLGAKILAEDLIDQKNEFLKTNPRGDWILFLVKNNTPFHLWEPLYPKVKNSFYDRPVPPHIKLDDCALELLKKLCQNNTLYLVTQGSQNTQSEKIRILNISHFFREIFITPSKKFPTKTDAYNEIKRYHPELQASQFLCIGNRVDTDLAPAKGLGWNTCWVDQGEHLAIRPANFLEKPDYVLNHVCDIFKIWSDPTQVSYLSRTINPK